jgi:hypothetical protein
MHDVLTCVRDLRSDAVDANDVGTEVSEQHRGKRSGSERAKFDDSDATQRPVRRTGRPAIRDE